MAEVRLIDFEVIDNKTGKEPDYEEIIVNEEWAKDLIWCDVEGIAITENRALILADECGRFAYAPEGRFAIKVKEDSLRPKGRWEIKHRHRGGFRQYTGHDEFGNLHTITVDERFESDDPYCPFCGKCNESEHINFCPNCGADMRGDAT